MYFHSIGKCIAHKDKSRVNSSFLRHALIDNINYQVTSVILKISVDFYHVTIKHYTKVILDKHTIVELLHENELLRAISCLFPGTMTNF
jgi:hypothetical protein